MLSSFSAWIYERSRNYLNIKNYGINHDTIENIKNAERSVSAQIIVMCTPGTSDNISPFRVTHAWKQVLR